jgi:ABC-type sugar transport system ATPase subunit
MSDVSKEKVILEMIGITKSFTGVTVLHNVSLTLREGSGPCR